MKLLKRIQLINWHYFTFETIEFGKINFLTGKNASGKTTIIDAIQLIFLGDTAGHFFNKSASDKSSRTLNGYLRCETGDDSNGNPRYKRDKGNFSSYIAAEIEDDKTGDIFTIGCVFDCFEDLTFSGKYFTYEAPFPESRFLKNRIPVSMKELRAYLFDIYPQADLTFFETNISYREYIKKKFGDIGNNFFSLFKKSIPFAPITNIETFITDYVCDIKNNIDISIMQQNIRDYSLLETEANILKKRVESLSEIERIFSDLVLLEQNSASKQYVMMRAEKSIKGKSVEYYKEKLDELARDIADQNRLLGICRDKLAETQKRKDDLITERATSDDFQRKTVLTQQVTTIKEKIENLEGQLNLTCHNLARFRQSWLTTLDQIAPHLKKLNLVSLDEALLNVKIEFTKIPHTLDKILELDEEMLRNLQTSINSFKDLISDNLRNLKYKAADFTDQIQDIERQINTIDSGHKNYDPKLVLLRDLISEELSRRYEKDVEVHILADLLEVKHEVWRKPLEAYLGPQRFYIVVEPQYVDESIAIYDNARVEHQLNEYGIIDTEKMFSRNVHVEKRSLSEEIITSNKYARKYIDSLLGTLIKCENLAELRNFNRSLTPSGMIYQNFVARQLPVDKIQPFLGNNAGNSVKRGFEVDLKNLRANRESCYQLISHFDCANRLEILSTNEISNTINSIANCTNIKQLHIDYDDVNFKLKNIGSANYYDHIKSSLDEVDRLLIDLRLEEEQLVISIAKDSAQLEKIQTNDLPVAEISLKEISDQINAKFKDPDFVAASDALFLEKLGEVKTPQAVYNNLEKELELVNSRISELQRKLLTARVGYVNEYKVDFDTNDLTSNHQFDEQLIELRDNKLVAYTEKIAEAKSRAMQQFQDNFMAKLKSNFDTVKMQIDNLNYALASSRFGNDSYKFTMTPRREYAHFYSMINDALLISGHDIFSDEFVERHRDTIDELFSLITVVDFASTDIQRDMEENIAKFTDYRTYFKFDLEVHDINGHVQSLAKNLLKKSGGETQTPFYISILASFAQLYRIVEAQEQGEAKSDTIRLIVFDEAFSKMDSERIQESVRLLRGYGLQALISAPPEKMPEIVPFVDETLCVFRQDQNSRVANYKQLKGKSLINN